eukprot:g66127.t1
MGAFATGFIKLLSNGGSAGPLRLERPVFVSEQTNQDISGSYSKTNNEPGYSNGRAAPVEERPGYSNGHAAPVEERFNSIGLTMGMAEQPLWRIGLSMRMAEQRQWRRGLIMTVAARLFRSGQNDCRKPERDFWLKFNGPDYDNGRAAPAGPARLTFKRDIWPIFQRLGVTLGHGYSSGTGLVMEDAEGAYRNIFQVSSHQVPQMMLLQPCAPELSYLYQKLQGSHRNLGGYGKRMPPGAPADDSDILMVAQWISDGAPFDATSTSTYPRCRATQSTAQTQQTNSYGNFQSAPSPGDLKPLSAYD